MLVKELMSPNVITIEKSRTVKQAATLMDAHDIGTLIIMENGGYVGVFTERDIIRQIVAMDINPSNVEVGTFMSREPITINENKSISEASRTMTLHNVKRLIVLDDNEKLTGLITSTDIARRLAKKLSLGQ